MNKKDSVALYAQGVVKWNGWAEKMLAQRTSLTERGEWEADVNPFTGETFGDNTATQEWLEAAMCDFSDEIFESEVSFNNFIFPGDAKFIGAQFNRDVRFDGATFRGFTHFDKVEFAAYAGFVGTKFFGEAGFSEATFALSGNFSGTEFSRSAAFLDVTFDTAVFPGAKFMGHAEFNGSKFNTAYFSQAMFDGGVASFSKAEFSITAQFLEVAFKSDVQFNEADFQGVVMFDKTTFADSTTFARAKFKGITLFTEALFIGKVAFNQAIFENSTSFFQAVFQEESSFVAMVGKSVFSLEEATFFSVPDFGQANFSEALRLDNSRFNVFPVARRMSDAHMKRDVATRWRTLKRLAVQGHDYERELDFLAEEIRSLRGVQDWMLPNPLSLRKGDPICWPGGGRYWTGLLYEWLSDFGRSAFRPLFWWIIVTSAFGAYYLSHHPEPLERDKQAISLSSSTFSCNATMAALYITVNNGLVISGFGRPDKLAQNYACLYRRAGEDGVTPIIPYGVVFAELGQTLISAVLIFLIILALRNYFRIK